ncbi:MAG TPA: 2OG-Fe(II) oxygenase [Acidimicrobiia bacterium]|nr:2OG-Fe(II) oxygenase [Acidimicrobiia bacterium]
MNAPTTPRSELLVEIDGLAASITLPEPLRASLAHRLGGPVGSPSGAPALHYAVAGRAPDRYRLERGHAGLRHNVTATVAIQALLTDLPDAMHGRRPDLVFARASAVSVHGRGVVVLGLRESTPVVDALVEAGATLLSTGLVVFDRSGHVLPILVAGGASPDAHDRAEPRSPSAGPVMLMVATDRDPTSVEVTGARAALALLEHVVPNQQRTPAARSLLGRLAPHLTLLGGAARHAEGLAGDIIRRAEQQPIADLPRSSDDAATCAGTPEREGQVTRARHLRFDDFLPPEQHRRLLEHALSREADLAPSQVLTDEEVDDQSDLRRSQTVFDLDEVWDLLERRLVGLLPHIRRELDINWFDLGSIERQLTVHGDGDHFALHVDDARPDVAAREVSAIYYFNREPQGFSGGELRLFDTVEVGGRIEPADTFTEVVPKNNTLVVFGSEVPHEVRPVHVPGDAFGDRRFTIVCWARRGKTPAEVFTGDRDRRDELQHRLLPALTADGFRVVPTPAYVQARLAEFFAAEAASATDETADENILPTGTPSFVDVGELGTWVQEELRSVHEQWCQAPLEPTSYYGLRVYREGQTLARHADRYETHVISSVVHVAADVDEPWPLVIEDREGRRHDVYLEPGQLLLYEGAKLPHSRPHPLRGRHYASLFLHYRPTDWLRTLARVCRDATRQGES